LLDKIGATKNILLVVSDKNDLVKRATANIRDLKVTQAKYLNVFDVLNADSIILDQKSIEIINEWLGGTK
jgi:ribosomal protein L4